MAPTGGWDGRWYNEDRPNPRFESELKMTIKAIFENGVFRPAEPVHFPEKSIVRLEAVLEQEGSSSNSLQAEASQKRVWEILSRRYHGGEPDAAERHNEHQP